MTDDAASIAAGAAGTPDDYGGWGAGRETVPAGTTASRRVVRPLAAAAATRAPPLHTCVAALLLYVRAVWDLSLRGGKPPGPIECDAISRNCRDDHVVLRTTIPASSLSQWWARLFDPDTGAARSVSELLPPGGGNVVSTCWQHRRGTCVRCLDGNSSATPAFTVGMTAANYREGMAVLEKTNSASHTAAALALHEALPRCDYERISRFLPDLTDDYSPGAAARLWVGTMGFMATRLQLRIPAADTFYLWPMDTPLLQNLEGTFSQTRMHPDGIFPVCQHPDHGAVGADVRRAFPNVTAAALLPTSATVMPYYPRVIIIRGMGRDMPAHELCQEVMACIGMAESVLQPTLLQAAGVYIAVAESHEGGGRQRSLLLGFLEAVYGPAILPRIVVPPLLAGEFLSPDLHNLLAHAPTAATANRRIRDNLRLDARPAIACTVHGSLAAEGPGVNSTCTVPAEATLPWASAHWGVPPYAPGPERVWPPPRAPQQGGTAVVAVDEDGGGGAHRADRTLTVLLLVRGGHARRRMHNFAELWETLSELADRMLHAHSTGSRYLVFRDDDGQMRDPVTLLKLFHQADVIIAVHGAGITNIMGCRPGTHLLEFTTPGYSTTMYAVFPKLANALGMFATLLPSTPAVESEPEGAVTVDVGRLRAHLERIYLDHDYGPREYPRL